MYNRNNYGYRQLGYINVGGRNYKDLGEAYDDIKPDCPFEEIESLVDNGAKLHEAFFWEDVDLEPIFVAGVKYRNLYDAYVKRKPPVDYITIRNRLLRGEKTERAFFLLKTNYEVSAYVR